MVEQPGDVVIFGCTVDDHVDVVGTPRDHEVIEYSACLIQQEGITLLPHRQRRDAGRNHCFERSVDVISGEGQLPHMADVEQTGVGTRPQMLCHDALVLEGHLIAGERNHPAPLRTVPGIERQQLRRQFAVGVIVIYGIKGL